MTTIKDVTFNASDVASDAKLADHSRQQQNTSDVFTGLSGKRVYFCQRCLNHDILAPRKNHKCECVHAQCNCAKCILVERRRVLNTQLHELEENEQQNQRYNNNPPTKEGQQLSENYFQNVFVFEKNESAQSNLQLAGNDKLQDVSDSAWKNSILYKTLSERLRPQATFQGSPPKQERGLETLQALLLQNGVYSNSRQVVSNLSTVHEQLTSASKKVSIDSPVDESGFGNDADSEMPFGDISFPKESRENSLTSVDSFSGKPSGNDSEKFQKYNELHSFRSRISTMNSIKSSTTTNSSSSATSPVAFSADGNALRLDGDCMMSNSLNHFQAMSPAFSYNSAATRMKGERVPNCQKCGQHGHKSRLKGHKRYCPFKNCNCAKCQVITERQKLMADQIKIRRRQCKDTLMRLKRDKMCQFQQHAIDDNYNMASRLQFPAEQSLRQSCPTISASYFNALNVLCKQFTCAPMMSPQRTSIITHALPTVGMSAPIATATGGVIKCTNAAHANFQADRATDKASKSPGFFASSDVLEQQKLVPHSPNQLISNFLLPSQQTKFFHNFAKSAQNNVINEAKTSASDGGQNVSIPAANYPNSFNDDHNNVTVATENAVPNLNFCDKARAEAFLRFLQQRQQLNFLNFYSAMAANYQQKEDQFHPIMKRQQMECDEQQPLLNQQKENQQQQHDEELVDVNSCSDQRNVHTKPDSLMQLLSLNHEEKQQQTQQQLQEINKLSVSDMASTFTIISAEKTTELIVKTEPPTHPDVFGLVETS